MAAAASYDAGEEIRVTRDGANRLHVHHGAREIATIARAIGGDFRLAADGRTWHLTQDDDGWTATGDPMASLTTTFLGGRRLTIGQAVDLRIRGKKVKGLLRFAKDTDGPKPSLKGTILKAPPADPHAVIALATAAVALGVDLDDPPPHIPAQETPGVRIVGTH